MKILNCCLLEKSYNSIPVEAWKDGTSFQRFLPFIGVDKNVYDESGLEVTRRNLVTFLDVETTVFFVTEENIRKEFLTLKAHGFRNIVQYIPVRKNDFIEGLKKYLDKKKPDLIIMGKESTRLREGTSAAYIAEYLNWPCVGGVTDFSIENENSVKLKINTEDEIITEVIQLPAVIVMGEAPELILKTPKRKDKLPFMEQMPEKTEFDVPNLNPENEELIHKEHIRKCSFITGETGKKRLLDEVMGDSL